MDTGEVESFTFNAEDPVGNGNEEEKEMEEAEVNNLNMWLYLKDRFNISNEAWHELAMNSEDPPSLNKLIKHMNKINTNWDLKPTPGDTEGMQISFRKSLSEQIKRLRDTGTLKPGDMVKIKVSGDRTNVGKRLSVINITYTILNEKQQAVSEKGNYLLAILKEKESYHVLSVGLSDLIKEMEESKTIKVDNIYEIEYFLGGDWKFLASVCGIGAPNADYAYIWCKCPKLQSGLSCIQSLEPEHWKK